MTPEELRAEVRRIATGLAACLPGWGVTSTEGGAPPTIVGLTHETGALVHARLRDKRLDWSPAWPRDERGYCYEPRPRMGGIGQASRDGAGPRSLAMLARDLDRRLLRPYLAEYVVQAARLAQADREAEDQEVLARRLAGVLGVEPRGGRLDNAWTIYARGLGGDDLTMNVPRYRGDVRVERGSLRPATAEAVCRLIARVAGDGS